MTRGAACVATQQRVGRSSFRRRRVEFQSLIDSRRSGRRVRKKGEIRSVNVAGGDEAGEDRRKGVSESGLGGRGEVPLRLLAFFALRCQRCVFRKVDRFYACVRDEHSSAANSFCVFL